jgi:hypothetical protein
VTRHLQLVLSHDEIKSALTTFALSSVDLGAPFANNDATVAIEAIELGMFRATIELTVEGK